MPVWRSAHGASAAALSAAAFCKAEYRATGAALIYPIEMGQKMSAVRST